MILKALSIRQPWAGFILTGKKPVENRTWEHAYNGPLLIHASKTWDERDLCEFYELAGVPYFDSPVYRESWYSKDCRFVAGSIIGIVMKGPCVPVSKNRQEPATPWHDPSAVWWPLRYAVPLIEPIPYSGQRGLFDVDLAGGERLDHPEFRTIKQYINANTKGGWIR